MRFGKSILGNYTEGTEREWLLTNGRGSFAMGSVNGNHARRYHGLLVSSFNPPLDRYLVFHKVEEELDGTNLATARLRQAGDTILDGYRHLDSFELDPFPRFVWSAQGVILEKEIFMPYGQEAVVLRYRLLSAPAGGARLRLNLWFNHRDFHQMGSLPPKTRYAVKALDDGLSFRPGVKSGHPVRTVCVWHSGGEWTEAPVCREGLVYDIEEAHRGDSATDTSFRTGWIDIQLAEGQDWWLVAATGMRRRPDPEALRAKEIRRQGKLRNLTSRKDPFLRDLAVAADSFIVWRQGTRGMTVLAGYPWFGDWGRDTMIALPGLTLSTGRYEDARSILATFAAYCSEGMLPNKFPDWEGEELMYNTIDASLWYFYAVHQYLVHTEDYDFIRQTIWPSLKEIIAFHLKGTRYGIRVDPADGLLSGGDASTQLTWMDVKYEGWAVTPRWGKAVEINALWYNALRIMASLAARFGEDAVPYTRQAEICHANFADTFWNRDAGCLYDYVTPTEKNTDPRPNQIFAVSLPHSLLSAEQEKAVVDTVLAQCWTPHGLKSIAESDHKFIGSYLGTLKQRDSCYHQGTVWSWPVGHFITAHRKVYGDTTKLALLLRGLEDHFYQEACLNNVSEIFDGAAPHAARGCAAQAWSVGELIRVLKEDLGRT